MGGISLELAKICHYALYFISFIGLLVPCYFLYMNDAIKKSEEGATSVTKRSKCFPFEVPTIIICAEPGFKPSVSKKYNLDEPPRFIFNNVKGTNIIGNRSVPELWEEFSYANDLNIVYD